LQIDRLVVLGFRIIEDAREKIAGLRHSNKIRLPGNEKTLSAGRLDRETIKIKDFLTRWRFDEVRRGLDLAGHSYRSPMK